VDRCESVCFVTAAKTGGNNYKQRVATPARGVIRVTPERAQVTHCAFFRAALDARRPIDPRCGRLADIDRLVRFATRLLEREHWPAWLLVVAMGTAYTAVDLARLDHFEPLEWDLAIFGQGVWLLSRGKTPYVSVRGLNLLGEHATFVHLPLAVAYRVLGPLAGVRVLVLAQSLALAGTGLALHAWALPALGRAAAGLVLVAYLFYPPLQYTWGEYYQPIALALLPLVLAFRGVEEGRTRGALLWSAAALLCMENVAATVAALGVYALVRRRPRIGVPLVAIAGTYVAVLLGVWFPWLNPGRGYVYANRLFGDFARDLPGAVAYLAHPAHLLGRLATAENGRYLLGLLVPVAFLPLAAPGPLAVAAQLPLNLVSSWPYAHELRYHYVALVVPFVFLSLVAALRRSSPGSRIRAIACGALLASVVAGQLLYAPPWLSYRGDDVRADDVRALLRRIPAELAVSADYPFLPHLCHRQRLYMFPELDERGGFADVALVDLRLAGRGPEDTEALRRLPVAGYREGLRTPAGVVLYVRGNPPGLDLGTPIAPSKPGLGPPSARPVTR
jgi:uncharacterized membrane protein